MFEHHEVKKYNTKRKWDLLSIMPLQLFKMYMFGQTRAIVDAFRLRDYKLALTWLPFKPQKWEDQDRAQDPKGDPE